MTKRLSLYFRRAQLLVAHYRIARRYTSRREAAGIAWMWASMLDTPARGVALPDGAQR